MTKITFRNLTDFFKALIVGDTEKANSITFNDMLEDNKIDEDMEIFEDD